MERKYFNFVNEITTEELYEKLLKYGLFSEKLPPVFDGEDFFNYCMNKKHRFADKWYQYVTFDNMRNVNIPRSIGIPVPMAHERICWCLKANWNRIKKHFYKKTSKQKYIVSRIHIRKMANKLALFEMNYSNWNVDGTPEPDISMGKKYLVKADISKCFSSIYSHAIAWALVSKDTAKQNNKKDNWYNDIDKEVRNSTNGETNGLLIGPHTSNVLSEIILCSVDYELCKKWEYIRHIDDYACYVETKDDAEKFLIALSANLKNYDLSLNHKKVEIVELPVATVEQWVNKLNGRNAILPKTLNYNDIRAFMDFCIELMIQNNDNASVVLYGLKVLKNHELTFNAQQYIVKISTSLALNYPYFVPLLDNWVYSNYYICKEDLSKYLNMIYDKYMEKDIFEAVAYSLYLARKYDIEIKKLDVHKIIKKKDCILLLCCLIYCRHFKLNIEQKDLLTYAQKLQQDNEFEENWIFAYECLSVNDLKDEWKSLKRKKVSFLLKEYR